uniref:NADH-ubiquinone oxidoreductase chain 2 n=2 Tax=Hemidactylus frenatus TaxID=47729 RepID=A0A4P8W5W1_HEMFR|nr:NADH dehydrogenase subunit 2 [Hemidactylus frenatus]QCS36737.1 NADH dehydrogenase subunit 2 [Hemidactylus frenatus]QCS36738.1 NADH dehydrogenase subunit 2 [Hemidactylus frenatus]
MNPLIWTVLIASLTTSTMITFASSHWLLAWLSLELNTLSILPIMMKQPHPRMVEATTKYFIIQSTAAACILFASTINAWQTGLWSIMHTNSMLPTTLITIAIMLKLGLAPTHLWYPEILQGTPLTTAMLISTWQKLAPLALLYMLHNTINMALLLTIAALSTIIGGWTGLNQTQTRKIMAFSSISHMGWLLIALNMNQNLATLTMLTYLAATTAMFTTLSHTTTKTIHDAGTTWMLSPALTLMMMITLMSLGGLPPLTGFMPKWLIIKDLASINLLPISALVLAASLPSLFFYTRIAYMTMLTTPPTTTSMNLKWRFSTTTPPISTMPLTITCMVLPMTAALYNTT